MSLENFKDEKSNLDEDYLGRVKKQTKIWDGFEKKTNTLTNLVHSAFSDVLNDIPLKDGMYSAKITNFEVHYRPDLKDFYIKIKEIQTGDGKVIGGRLNPGCPHMFLEPLTWGINLHPKIKKFKENYGIQFIEDPDNNCDHA